MQATIICPVLRTLYTLVPLLRRLELSTSSQLGLVYQKESTALQVSSALFLNHQEESKHQQPPASPGRSIPLLALINNLAQKVPALTLVAGSDPAQLHTHTRVSINTYIGK